MNLKTAVTLLTLATGLMTRPGLAANGEFNRVVDARIAAYARAFPEIGFIRLGGEHQIEAMGHLLAVLGQRAANLDYEHGNESRNILVDLQVHRIGLMMQSQSPSATLFDLGSDSLYPNPLVCVITLDPEPFETDTTAAAHFLGVADTISTHGSVDNHEFLRFTVDHEVFHCLNAYANGPTYSMNSSDRVRLREEQQSESRADYFAAVSHLAEGGDWKLVRHLLLARQRGRETGDLAHDTEAALLAALRVSPQRVRSLSLRDRARFAFSY